MNTMFAQRLRALRTGRKLTLKQLSNALNHKFKQDLHKNTSSQIGNWERGLRAPSYLEIRKLAEFFNVTMDYLSGRTPVNKLNLAEILIGDHDVVFNEHQLSKSDQYQIYELINGYVSGINHRPYKKHRVFTKHQQENLNLNLK